MTNNSNYINSYRALALQVTCHAVNQVNPKEDRLIIHNTIQRLEKQIAASLAFIGSDCRLVVLPEYFLNGSIEPKHFIQTQKQTIERLSNLGII